MATLFSRLALFGTLALFGSGCTLHVVSGPVSQQRADNQYHYAMTPDRARVLRPAPRPLPREGRAQPRPVGDARSLATTSEGRKRPRRDARPARMDPGREGQPTRADSGTSKRRSLAERRRLADVRQRNKDSKRPDSTRPKGSETADDDSRNVRFPYWVSKNDERIELDGTQVERERRPGDRKALH